MLKLGRYWPWKTVSSHFHMLVRPMLLHRMALVSLRLFCKIWATCKNFLGKWFTAPPPGRKLPVRLCIRVNYCALRWIPWKERVRLEMWSEVNKGTLCVMFSLFNIQGLWILFPYCLAGTKTSEELQSGIVICHEEKLVMGVVRKTTKSSEFLTHISIR